MFISVSLERYTQEQDFQFLSSVAFELQVQGLELPPEAVNEHNSSPHPPPQGILQPSACLYALTAVQQEPKLRSIPRFDRHSSFALQNANY